MSLGKLYTSKEHCTTKVLLTASFTGQKLDIPPCEAGKDNITPEFLKKNPFGKLPVLELSDGFVFESAAICKHICRVTPKSGLLGRNDLEASQVDQWCDFNCNELEPSAMTWLGPILGHTAFNEELNRQAQDNIKNMMKALNQYFERHQFLVGERITLADIVVAATFVPLYGKVIEPRLRSPVPCLNRWLECITQQPAFKSVVSLPPAMWCTVPQPVIKFAEKGAKADKKEKKEAKKEEKKQEKKEEKKEKKEEKKPKAKEPEEEEENYDDEPKAKNPLDLLPKSSFILDTYKREYSNNKIEDSCKWLWENFDAEGYSMWWSNYKYNEECTVLFRTTNLVGGFFQRLERMHKYAFGQMVICGEDNKHELSGFWIIRGQELPATLLDVPDTELYDWVKLDVSKIDDAEKLKIQKILNWECDYNGKPCLDGKTFK
eukprot:TRINITY_DN10320_c1_g1_i3.p1 TRINITY_DN10320_c1_g1~~TRINITY_DN10320_c1_g1_i3.p1  ORF type:complete len:433 (+),score=132.68 TRINITY_DN10320_c1_g1_i3:55-1353(+)